jgi:hypothetical protein
LIYLIFSAMDLINFKHPLFIASLSGLAAVGIVYTYTLLNNGNQTESV